MSAMVLQFRAPRSRFEVVESDADSDRDIIGRWLSAAERYGWFLVDSKPRRRRAAGKLARRPAIVSFTIGHRAVDQEGIYELTPEFDGWALLSRRGELSVFATLASALASICPAIIAA